MFFVQFILLMLCVPLQKTTVKPSNQSQGLFGKGIYIRILRLDEHISIQ